MTTRNVPFIATIIIGLGVLFPLQRSIDAARPEEKTTDEMLFLSSGDTIKRMSFGLEGLAADIYWIRTTQYFGRKMVDSGKPLSSATADVRMDLLAPLLNIVVTLDPHHLPAYRFGALFLPERDMPAAVDLLERGIRDNPNDWRMYQDLGYVYWQAGKNSADSAQEDYYDKSAVWFDKGGDVPGAPWWMHDLAGLMKIRGGSRDAARAVYTAYLNSEDQNVRAQALDRLKQLQALDEVDLINSVLARYKEQTGVCPADLRGLASKFRSMNLTLGNDSTPIDPDGFPYAYDFANCQAAVAFASTISK